MYHRLRVGLLVVFCLSIGNLFGRFAQHFDRLLFFVDGRKCRKRDFCTVLFVCQ